MESSQFIKIMKNFKGEGVFNPYTDICTIHDKKNAEKIRTKNLSEVIESSLSTGVDSLWLGRDLGYKGGRRTGLALTDEANLSAAQNKWSACLNQATKGQPQSERTAATIWNFVSFIELNIFMWNVFPFHPHEELNPFTNRSHTAKEREIGLEILTILITLLKPKRIIAIGNDAYSASLRVFESANVYKVRHPSYGGEGEFSLQICELYDLNLEKILQQARMQKDLAF